MTRPTHSRSLKQRVSKLLASCLSALFALTFVFVMFHNGGGLDRPVRPENPIPTNDTLEDVGDQSPGTGSGTGNPAVDEDDPRPEE